MIITPQYDESLITSSRKRRTAMTFRNTASVKRLAILLGQSRYMRLPPIQACQNDLTSMRQLLESTACFDHILVLDDAVETALDAKEQLRSFLTSNSTEAVNELFFYFTGHGYFDGEEFIFLWKNFDPEQQQQTALASSEIDQLLAQVHPELLVKVVDACNSESSISKVPLSPEGYDHTAKDLFKNTYCLFSSQRDQYSLADSAHSFFTSLFFQAINRPVGTRVRYRDIIDFISEAFEKIGRQTPVFVTHADFTEQFCIITKQVKELLERLDLEQQKVTVSKQVESDLLDRVRLEAAQYVSLDEAKQCLRCGLEALTEFQLNLEFSNFFEKDVQSTLAYTNIPKIEHIAQVLAASDDELYAHVLYDTEHYDITIPVEYTVLGPPAAIKGISTRLETRTQSREIPKSYENNFELPYVAMCMTLKSRFANLLSQAFVVVPVLARTRLYYFYTTATYKRVDWDRQAVETSAVQWEHDVFPYNCYQIKTMLTKLIQEKFLAGILKDMKHRFGILSTSNEEHSR